MSNTTEVIPEFICDDCGNDFDKMDGRYYKYDPDLWLCDDCHDERMEE